MSCTLENMKAKPILDIAKKYATDSTVQSLVTTYTEQMLHLMRYAEYFKALADRLKNVGADDYSPALDLGSVTLAGKIDAAEKVAWYTLVTLATTLNSKGENDPCLDV
jgi:hypothetical protein